MTLDHFWELLLVAYPTIHIAITIIAKTMPEPAQPRSGYAVLYSVLNWISLGNSLQPSPFATPKVMAASQNLQAVTKLSDATQK